MAEEILSHPPVPKESINDQEPKVRTIGHRVKLKKEHIEALVSVMRESGEYWRSSKSQREFLKTIQSQFQANLVTAAAFYSCGCMAAEIGGSFHVVHCERCKSHQEPTARLKWELPRSCHCGQVEKWTAETSLAFSQHDHEKAEQLRKLRRDHVCDLPAAAHSVYRYKDAARFIGVDAGEFMRLVREGNIPCVFNGTQRRYLLKDLEAFRDRRAGKDGGES